MSVVDVMSAIGSIVIIILILVLAFYASRWYAKKMGTMGGGGGKYVKIIDKTTVGQAASLLVVKITDRYYLIGVSDKNIQLLSELENFDEQQQNPPPQSEISFKQIFKGFVEKDKKPANKKDNGDT